MARSTVPGSVGPLAKGQVALPIPTVGAAVVVAGEKYRIQALDGGTATLAHAGPHWRSARQVAGLAATEGMAWEAVAGLFHLADPFRLHSIEADPAALERAVDTETPASDRLHLEDPDAVDGGAIAEPSTPGDDGPECELNAWCDMPGGHTGLCRAADEILEDRPSTDGGGRGDPSTAGRGQAEPSTRPDVATCRRALELASSRSAHNGPAGSTDLGPSSWYYSVAPGNCGGRLLAAYVRIAVPDPSSKARRGYYGDAPTKPKWTRAGVACTRCLAWWPLPAAALESPAEGRS